MEHTAPLPADRFLFTLRGQLRNAPQEAIDDAFDGAATWSRFMFHALQGAAKDCGMVSCAAKNEHGPKWMRREHLFDVTWFRSNCGDWETPELILEHENQWDKIEFLKDFWKLLLGYAPIRVMIGYCRRESDKKSWIDEVNGILAHSSSHIRFPSTVDDFILLGHRGMTTTGFAVYRRSDTRFEQTVDSLDALIPNPRDTKAWSAYLQKAQVAMTNRLHVEIARLREGGIIDEHGQLLIDTVPPDMKPEADTSVATG